MVRVSCTERNLNKEILHKMRPNDKNVENSIFGIRVENKSVLGERHMAGNQCRSKGKKGDSVCSGWMTSKMKLGVQCMT